MLSFIIYLPGHEKTKEHLSELLKTNLSTRWNAALFPGINGLEVKFPYKIDERYPKSVEQMKRPGVRGCFMSHYELWKLCAARDEPIGIFESDILFLKGPPSSISDTCDYVRLDGFRTSKPASTGLWHEGAHAYILNPSGARKLLEWTEKWGASPADYMLGDKVLKIKYDFEDRVKLVDLGFSLTWNLEEEMLQSSNEEN